MASDRYAQAVAGWPTWNKKRRLFLVQQLAFLALLVLGVVLMFLGHGLAHILTWAIFLVVVTVANLALRLTYFRTVLPEIREERERFRS